MKPTTDATEKINQEAPVELAYKHFRANEPELDGFDPDSEEVRRVRSKVDKRLIPMLSLLYLCSYLDRVNLGMENIFLASTVTAPAHPH